jgi:hypothetical protein
LRWLIYTANFINQRDAVDAKPDMQPHVNAIISPGKKQKCHPNHGQGMQPFYDFAQGKNQILHPNQWVPVLPGVKAKLSDISG